MCGATSQRPFCPHTASALQLGSLLIIAGHASLPQRCGLAASNPATASLRIAICLPPALQPQQACTSSQSSDVVQLSGSSSVIGVAPPPLAGAVFDEPQPKARSTM